MAFTVREFRDLLQVLDAHPEWRDELRRRVLSEDMFALPQIVRELAEAQQRTEARVEELAAAQQRTEARVEELAAAQRRTEARLDALIVQIQQLTARVDALTEAQRRTYQELGDLRGFVRGQSLEAAYRANAFRYQSLLRRPNVLERGEITSLLSTAVEADRLSSGEAYDLSEADVLVRGVHKREDRPLWLVVEVSQTVDTDDVEKAVRRAGLLAEALAEEAPQPDVLAVVAGEAWPEPIQTAVRQGRVALLQDGQVVKPDKPE